MDTKSVYFYAYLALILIIAVLDFLPMVIKRKMRVAEILSHILNIPMLLMVFLSGGGIDEALLSLLITSFFYTVSLYFTWRRENK